MMVRVKFGLVKIKMYNSQVAALNRVYLLSPMHNHTIIKYLIETPCSSMSSTKKVKSTKCWLHYSTHL